MCSNIAMVTQILVQRMSSECVQFLFFNYGAFKLHFRYKGWRVMYNESDLLLQAFSVFQFFLISPFPFLLFLSFSSSVLTSSRVFLFILPSSLLFAYSGLFLFTPSPFIQLYLIPHPIYSTTVEVKVKNDLRN